MIDVALKLNKDHKIKSMLPRCCNATRGYTSDGKNRDSVTLGYTAQFVTPCCCILRYMVFVVDGRIAA